MTETGTRSMGLTVTDLVVLTAGLWWHLNFGVENLLRAQSSAGCSVKAWKVKTQINGDSGGLACEVSERGLRFP